MNIGERDKVPLYGRVPAALKGDNLRVARTVFVSSWPGFMGQLFNLIALLIAIGFASPLELIRLVLCASVTNAFLNTAILAAPMLYPSIPTPRAAATAFNSSMSSLLLVSSVLVVTGAALSVRSIPVGPFVFYVGILSFAQGLYDLNVARIVRLGLMREFMRCRFAYGMFNVAATLIAVLLTRSAWALVVAGAFTYLLGAGACSFVVRRRTGRSEPVRLFMSRSYLASAGGPALAYLANGVATQSVGASLQRVGALAGAWALVTLIGGGFATINSQLLAPRADSMFSRAVRMNDKDGRSRAIKHALLAGIPSGLLAPAAGIVVVVIRLKPVRVDGVLLAELSFAAIAYWGSALLLTPSQKFLNLAGHNRSRAIWDACRLIIFLGIIVSTSGVLLLLSIATSALVLNLSYLAMLYRSQKSEELDPQVVVDAA